MTGSLGWVLKAGLRATCESLFWDDEVGPLLTCGPLACSLELEINKLKSGTKNEPKPKLLSLDIFRWGRGLPHEGVGAKKFGMPLETREIKLFGRDIPGFCWDIPGAPEKFEKKKFGFNFRSL